ncbi:hypothetical protein ACFLU6_05480 [Acidobacteriota bacterium]
MSTPDVKVRLPKDQPSNPPPKDADPGMLKEALKILGYTKDDVFSAYACKADGIPLHPAVPSYRGSGIRINFNFGRTAIYAPDGRDRNGEHFYCVSCYSRSLESGRPEKKPLSIRWYLGNHAINSLCLDCGFKPLENGTIMDIEKRLRDIEVKISVAKKRRARLGF